MDQLTAALLTVFSRDSWIVPKLRNSTRPHRRRPNLKQKYALCEIVQLNRSTKTHEITRTRNMPSISCSFVDRVFQQHAGRVTLGMIANHSLIRPDIADSVGVIVDYQHLLCILIAAASPAHDFTKSDQNSNDHFERGTDDEVQ